MMVLSREEKLNLKKPCEVCGKEMPVYFVGGCGSLCKRKYCSTKCGGRAWHRRKRGEDERDKKTFCVVCGEQMFGRNRDAKYCSNKCACKYHSKAKEHISDGIEAACIGCGNKFIKATYNNKICVKCRNDHIKKRVGKYGKEYRKKYKKRILKNNRDYYRNNRETILEQQKVYRRDHKKENNFYSRRYEKNNPGKILQIRSLRNLFNTAQLPLQVKKQAALVRLGKRINRANNIKPINKNQIGQILNSIEKGDTYVAYE